MKVHLIKESTVKNYVAQQSIPVAPFNEFLNKLKIADWEGPNDMKETFSSGNIDLLGKGSERVIIDIGGNNHRLIAKYKFADTMVHLAIKWMGTHAQYDKLKKGQRQYTISIF